VLTPHDGPARSASTDGDPDWFQARANRASPSTTTGSGACSIVRTTDGTVYSSRPNPGPITKAWKRSSPPSTADAQSNGGILRSTASTGDEASIPGLDTTTIPAPARWAAAAAR